MTERGGIVCGVARVRGRLGGPMMGSAVRHGRIRWESPAGDVNNVTPGWLVMGDSDGSCRREEIKLRWKDREDREQVKGRRGVREREVRVVRAVKREWPWGSGKGQWVGQALREEQRNLGQSSRVQHTSQNTAVLRASSASRPNHGPRAQAAYTPRRAKKDPFFSLP
jgi:hypothetical protein